MAKKAGQRIGYVRVSLLDQNAECQHEGIAVDRTFLDKLRDGLRIDKITERLC